ncbi:hypothetical protein A4A49_52785 [Nicotiana attenuata]|uniref:Uncharacterized protein n=1 Tax=Nicotiana attenuata TaxID=49451 RepID=A0A314L1V1_NICAT|nr:hypothetical protein A4A49_52785 [Nicotiana attenuata]
MSSVGFFDVLKSIIRLFLALLTPLAASLLSPSPFLRCYPILLLGSSFNPDQSRCQHASSSRGHKQGHQLLDAVGHLQGTGAGLQEKEAVGHFQGAGLQEEEEEMGHLQGAGQQEEEQPCIDIRLLKSVFIFFESKSIQKLNLLLLNLNKLSTTPFFYSWKPHYVLTHHNLIKIRIIHLITTH